jgi:ATP-dependent Clp protease ATP-binding subunit ClpC
MALVKLNIPTLVSDTQIEGVAHYYLRPFFIPYPIATHRRYENCVTLFRKEVRQVFKGFKLQGQNANQLLWFLFKPNLTYSQLDLEFTIGRQLISGKFAIAHFQMKGITFVSLPAFNNYMFIAHAGDGNRPSLEKSATKVVKTLMQRFKKEEGKLQTRSIFCY